MSVAKEDVFGSCSKQVFTPIHSIREMFESVESEAILLVDAANAFNNINRKTLLRNIKVLCPILGRYVNNNYPTAEKLFVIGGTKLNQGKERHRETHTPLL